MTNRQCPTALIFYYDGVNMSRCSFTLAHSAVVCVTAIVQAISDIGMFNLFTRGLSLRIFMIGTLTGAQWGLYDSFKVYVGL